MQKEPDKNQSPSVRPAALSDCPYMLEIYAPYVENTAISFEIEPPSLKEFEKRFIAFTDIFPWFVCEAEGVIAGYSYAHAFHERAAFTWTAECSVYVRDGFHGRKVGSALYRCLIETLKLQGLCTALAAVSIPNEKSEALHKAAGFERKRIFENVGYKLGAWRNVAWYSMKLSDYSSDPAPPTPAREIYAKPEFKNLLANSSAMIQL